MTRIEVLHPDKASGKSKELFDAVQKKLGMIPNLMKTMGHSPALLEGYLSFNTALESGVLDPQLRELIAVTVGEHNGCQYCVSAHSMMGEKLAKIAPEMIIAARSKKATTHKFDGALTFVHELLTHKGAVTDTALANVKENGYSEEEVMEIIGHVALNTLTNYFNNTCKTAIDFPKVELLNN